MPETNRFLRSFFNQRNFRMNTDLITLFQQLSDVYSDIDREYDRLARHYGNFSCTGCVDNCCTTVFFHYTLIEHLFLIDGFRTLADEVKKSMAEKAGEYARTLAEHPEDPTGIDLMCPANVDGLCGVYANRPLICRIHGLPSVLQSRGGIQRWKGCLRFQSIHGDAITLEMDRTMNYSKIAALEASLRKERSFFQKYRKTIADMILDWTRDGTSIVESIMASEGRT